MVDSRGHGPAAAHPRGVALHAVPGMAGVVRPAAAPLEHLADPRLHAVVSRFGSRATAGVSKPAVGWATEPLTAPPSTPADRAAFRLSFALACHRWGKSLYFPASRLRTGVGRAKLPAS